MDADVADPTVTGNRKLLTGGVLLLSAGSVLVLVGALVTGGVAVRASHRWVQQWEEPPRVAARRRLGQARSAVSAGARDWRVSGMSSPPAVGVGG